MAGEGPGRHREDSRGETIGVGASGDAGDVGEEGEAVDLGRLFRLDGQVAIVTGASSGLGVRFAEVLDSVGATVVICARRADMLERTATRLHRAVPVVADITDAQDREAVVEAARSITGTIDLLVNNAGLGAPIAAEDEPVEQFAHVVDVNLTSLFALSQLVGRHMLDQGHGNIINVASILGLVASAPIKQASYAASKAAVINLTRELAVQWARRGIRVNALAPGWFPSEKTTLMFEDPASMAFLQRNAPIGRGGELWELDGALLFLAGAASSYVTGHTLTVDGGWTAR